MSMSELLYTCYIGWQEKLRPPRRDRGVDLASEHQRPAAALRLGRRELLRRHGGIDFHPRCTVVQFEHDQERVPMVGYTKRRTIAPRADWGRTRCGTDNRSKRRVRECHYRCDQEGKGRGCKRHVAAVLLDGVVS